MSGHNKKKEELEEIKENLNKKLDSSKLRSNSIVDFGNIEEEIEIEVRKDMEKKETEKIEGNN